MPDYGSKDIDGMDDDANEEQGQNPSFTGRWTATSSYDVYMVDTHLKNLTTMTKNIQSRTNLLRHSQSTDDSGTVLSHAVKKTTIPTQEKTIL